MYAKRISPEDLLILKQCVEENQSITIMMLKTKLSRQTILNALRKHFGLNRKAADALGTK